MSDWNDAIEEAAKFADEYAVMFDKLYSGVSEDEQQRDRVAARSRTSSNLATIIRSLKRPAEQDGGWVLVPREPTDSMIEAAWDSFSAMCHSLVPEHCYKAMLSAAPASTETTTKGSSRG